MKVLIFHGYLLRGTGSNVYNASLATALARLGHEVHLLCQDREVRGLAAGTPGSVTIHNPDIGGLLPVFVRDEYEGFRVKTFAELDEEELSSYISMNVEAVGGVLEAIEGADAALANHLVMGPVILGRAGLRYALKVHGSDLSYAVLPDLDRFRPYAEEAVDGANAVLVGSTHIAERIRQAVGDRADEKLRLGPPGVDTALFAPLPAERREERLRELGAALRLGSEGEAAPGAWGRDPARAADAIEWFAGSSGPRVVFVGKLIVSKGVDLLIAAWPLVRAAHPGARLLLAGFGEYEAGLRRLVGALGAGDLEAAREIAARGRGLEGGQERALPILGDFLANPPAGYGDVAREADSSIQFTGRLEHDEVGALVPACDALVFPSTFPEAFGMVAAEAASAGVLPISAAHSGALEVSRELAAALPPQVAPLVSFPLDESAVGAIASRLDAWLRLPEDQRERARAALTGTVGRLWSWEGVARGVVAGAAGELDGLPTVA